jgi:hypothetical protein
MSLELVRQQPWYEDGNVILYCDEGLAAWKVHLSVLAGHSEVMAGMFAMDASADCERIEGCPAVRMYDDPAALDVVLRCVYGRALYVRRL